MLMTNLNKVRGLSPSERRLFVQSLLLLPLVHLALLLLGFARLRQVMERWAPLNNRTLSETEALQHAQEITRMVSIAAQHGLYRATCLRKSLLVWWFLRGEGIPSRLCFGVRILDHKLEAHAWVEWDGRIINDSANVREQYQSLHNGLPATRLGL
jgi:hypothetical protein